MNEFKSTAWSYHRQPDGKDEWLTPPEIVWSLSESFNGEKFDLDPCSPVLCPEKFFFGNSRLTEQHNGLTFDWSHHGRVWCNPPYRQAASWLKKCKEHNNAIAMVFSRTETKMFFDHVWNSADAVLFLKGRVTFYEFTCKACGKTISQHKARKSPSDPEPCNFLNSGEAVKAKWTGGGPSCLVAYGECNVDALEHANQEDELKGHLVYLGL